MSPRREAEHVGEVALDLEADDVAGLFAEATAVFRELVDGAGHRRGVTRRDVSLAAADPASLLADWLNELVFLAEVEAFVPERLERIELSNGLRATVAGARGRPRHLVKAATLNELDVHERDGRWHAHVVLDV